MILDHGRAFELKWKKHFETAFHNVKNDENF